MEALTNLGEVFTVHRISILKKYELGTLKMADFEALEKPTKTVL